MANKTKHSKVTKCLLKKLYIKTILHFYTGVLSYIRGYPHEKYSTYYKDTHLKYSMTVSVRLLIRPFRGRRDYNTSVCVWYRLLYWCVCGLTYKKAFFTYLKIACSRKVNRMKLGQQLILPTLGELFIGL
jgi:hypothetical protein